MENREIRTSPGVFMRFGSVTLIVIFIGLLLSSGCVTDISKQNESITSFQTTPVPVQSSMATSWIRINPINDFNTDLSFNITGSTTLTISGTTSYPEGTVLNLIILEEDTKSRYVTKSTASVGSTTSGMNSFSFIYDMNGNPPGEYRVIVSDSDGANSEHADFRISSEHPYYKSIFIDPIGPVSIGNDLPISGTTDLPAGSLIRLDTSVFLHSCPPGSTPDENGKRTVCGGSCRGTGVSHQTVRVAARGDGSNIWNTSVRTIDWCPDEAYQFYATAMNWTNVTPAWKLVNLAP